MDQRGRGEDGEKCIDLKYVLVLVAVWSSSLFHFLKSGNWMYLLINDISWFFFQHYFPFLVVLKIFIHGTIDTLYLMVYSKTC